MPRRTISATKEPKHRGLPFLSMTTETKLEMGERHVREGKARIARQRQLIEELLHDGHRTEEARRLLREFEAVQRELEALVDFLRRSN